MNKILLLHFCFLLFSITTFSQEIRIEVKEKSYTLEALIVRLEQDYGLLFSYKAADIQGVRVKVRKGSFSVDTFLNDLLEDSGLQFKVVRNNYVILSKERPDEESLSEVGKTGWELCGHIIDQNTGTPLPYANIYLKNARKGTSALEDGSFRLTIDKGTNDSLVISYVGYEEQRFSLTYFQSLPCPTIALSYDKVSEDFVVVTDYLTDGIHLNNHAAFTELRPNKLSVLPGQAEPDVLRTLQFLPGISSPDGSAANICIRGGTPDQNLILWEDIPVYHTAHQFGMISAFNPYMPQQVKVYRGGFGANFGGRISGVIDMKTEKQAPEKPIFGFGVNGLLVNTYGHLGIWDKKINLVYSLRRSISDLWKSPMYENINKRIHQGVLLQLRQPGELPPGFRIKDEADFWDGHLSMNMALTEKDQISVAGYYGENEFASVINDDQRKINQSDTLQLDNYGGRLSWTRQWSPNFSTEVRGVTSSYQYDYSYLVKSMQSNPPNKTGEKQSEIREQQLHLIGKYQLLQQHEIMLGYQLSDHEVAFQITRASRETTQAAVQQSRSSQVHAGYFNFHSNQTKQFGVDLGLRFSFFEKNNSKYLAPRLRLWYQPSPHLNFYLKGGRYYQFLSQLIEIEGDNASIETPVWVLAAEKEVPVLDAGQVLIGTVFQKKSWLIDIQLYTKKIKGLTSLSTGFDEALSNRFHIGEADIKGMDILVKKRWNNTRIWASYSLNQFDYKFASFFDPSFPAPNDQRHIFNIASSWAIGAVNISLGWKIASGLPYSLRENFRVVEQPPQMNMPARTVIRPDVESYNSERLPAEHQLDAAVTYTFLPKKGNSWKGVIGISLTNIYNQNNIYERTFFIDDRPNMPSKLTYANKGQMGFTPDIMFRVEF